MALPLTGQAAAARCGLLDNLDKKE